jgi:predicted NAD-dependent protein-ADP-ribosyltransferase YbiA (DUF1768 family)
MTAKMVGKPFRKERTRKDWDKIRINMMRWCIRVKLLQNWKSFSDVLLETGDMPIVEKSTKGDDFWGTVVVKEGKPPERKFELKRVEYYESPEMPAGFLAGYNLMGRLNQELRENIKTGIDPMTNNFTVLDPMPIENFLLCGKPIEKIFRR